MHCRCSFYCLDIWISPEDGQNGLKHGVINKVLWSWLILNTSVISCHAEYCCCLWMEVHVLKWMTFWSSDGLGMLNMAIWLTLKLQACQSVSVLGVTWWVLCLNIAAGITFIFSVFGVIRFVPGPSAKQRWPGLLHSILMFIQIGDCYIVNKSRDKSENIL
jgi:hypothetical protein